MVDFSKIFNIVFVSVCAALLLLLLISVIVVAAKGKRKCGAGDVLLRILSTLVLIASTAMVACAVLTMVSSGSAAIIVAEDGSAAALIFNNSITELPIPELFAALSTVIGFGLSAVLFILSLTALIVDCLVANKKEGKKNKKKEPAVKKSPEQLKREAELERIKRIGESAVRKTERVAKVEKTEKTEKVEKTEKAEKIEQPEKDFQPAAQAQPQDEQEDAASDWREQSAGEQHSGFVGIKDETDDTFDSFDSFDDEQPNAAGGDAEYGQADADGSAENLDEFVMPDDGQADEVQPDKEEIYYDADEQYTYDDGGVQGEEDYAQTELDETADGEGDNYDYAAADEQPTDEYGDFADESDGDYQTDKAEEYGTDGNTAEPQADRLDADDIEPDRGIYIPEIRTVTPRPTEVNTAAVKKPTAKKPSVKRPAKPKKSGDGGAAQKPAVGAGGRIPPEKKLPVTRRYVILDRHNAVNMFGEYLKERNQAEKDKLKSSINTIIIE